jgi:hypothetical protein
MNEQAIAELAAKARRGVLVRLPTEALQEKLRLYYRGQEIPAANMYGSDKVYRNVLVKEIIVVEFGLVTQEIT